MSSRILFASLARAFTGVLMLRCSALLSCVCLVIIGCGEGATTPPPGDGTTPAGAVSRVRVVHAAPRAPTLDAFVDGVLREGRIVYASASGYFDVAPGAATVAMHAILTGEPIASGVLATAPGSDATVIATGTYPDNDLLVLADSNVPRGDSVRLRVVHVSPSAGPLDVYVTEAGADLAGRSPLAAEFAYGQVSGYVTLPPGNWRIAAARVGAAVPLFDTGDIQLQPGDVRTALILDTSKGRAARGIAMIIDRAGP
jgi:hypothetical protein